MAPPTRPGWLGAARRAASGIRHLLADRPTIAERVRETGTTGEGGDRTLLIDEAAEALVFAQLEQLHEQGVRFTALSEERGVVDYGSEQLMVVIDPIDGSLNAKRGLPHHAVSIAVAEGPAMADVVFGFVQDFGPDEEWVAWRGHGARLNGMPLDATLGERRVNGRLEVVGVESADPRWVVASADQLAEVAHRIRAIGTMASAICQVAGARFDGMVSLRNSRAVDAAAAQLIAREAGGGRGLFCPGGPPGAP